MEDDLRDDTSGYFGRMMVALCAGGRETNEDIEPDKAEEDASQLYEVTCIHSTLHIQTTSQPRQIIKSHRLG